MFVDGDFFDIVDFVCVFQFSFRLILEAFVYTRPYGTLRIAVRLRIIFYVLKDLGGEVCFLDYDFFDVRD